MATSPNGYNHQLERTELRRQAARARHERQQRMTLIGGIVAIVVIAGAAIGLRSGRHRQGAANSVTGTPAPESPLVVSPANATGSEPAIAGSPRPAATGLTTVLPPAGGQVLSRHVRTEIPVTYDARVLPLLSDANLPAPLQQPTAIWKLQNGFGAQAANDGATYASISLGVAAPEKVMAQVARGIVASNPSASVKFVVRLDSNPPAGILRVAFDNKHQRAAWIKKSATAAGTPYNWWKAAGGAAVPANSPVVPAHHAPAVPAPADGPTPAPPALTVPGTHPTVAAHRAPTPRPERRMPTAPPAPLDTY